MMEILAGLAVSFFVQSASLTDADVQFLRRASFVDVFALTEVAATGYARIECVVEASGWLRQCRALEVSDARLADRLAEPAKGLQVAPETRSGEPTAGRTLEVVVRWRDGE